MIFTQVFADNFNRANQALATSPNWTWRSFSASNAGLQIYSNTQVSTITNASPNENLYSGALGPDHYAQCRMIVSTGEPGILVRCTKENTINRGYLLRWYKSTSLFYLYRIDPGAWPGAWTNLTPTVLYSLTSSEYVRLSCLGDVFTLSIDGVDKQSWTDSTYKFDYAGIAVDFQADFLDDFSAGTVSRGVFPFPFPRLT